MKSFVLTVKKNSYVVELILLFVLILVTSVKYNRSYIDATVFPKTLFFVQCLTLLFLYAIIKWLISKPIQSLVKFSRIDWSLIALFIYILINRYIIQPQNGFSIRFIELIGLGFLYLFLRNVPIKLFVWPLLAIVCGGLIQATFGVFQLLGIFSTLNSRFIITGSFMNSGPYSGFLAVSWIIALGIYIYREEIFRSFSISKQFQFVFLYVPLLCMGITLMALPAAASRASWLSIFAGSSLLIIYKYQVFIFVKRWSKVKKVILGLLTLILIGSTLFFLYQFKKDSANGRLLIWKTTSQIIKKNPIFGVGYDQFTAHYMDAQADYFRQHENSKEAMVADNVNFAFNELLQLASENGILGFILFISVCVFCIKSKHSAEKKYLKVVSLSVLLGVLVFASFTYPNQNLPIKIALVLVIALLANADERKDSYTLIQFRDNKKNSGLILKRITVVIIGFTFIAFSNYRLDKVDSSFINWKRAMDIFYSEKPNREQRSLELFNKVFPVLRKEGAFLKMYGKVLISMGQYKKSIEILELAKKYHNLTTIEINLGDCYKKLGDYKNSEQSYQNAVYMIPSRFYPNYLLVKLYEETGQFDLAVAKAKELLVKEVKVPSNAIVEIKGEMKRIIKNYNND